MTAYIEGIGLISPQQTTDPARFLPEVTEYTSDFLQVINPNYKEYINPIASRRMSKLIKMGITSAKIAMVDAGCQMPEAIITGTGLGSVEDTERILNGMNAGEQLMNPTPFIQSTYNTISSQIAISLQCHHYNSTYVHRAFSFESALQDALLQFEEKAATTALVGGIDEMTSNHLGIVRRTGHWKMEPVNNLQLLSSRTPGALAGEGAAFFVLRDAPSQRRYGILKDVKTFYQPKEFQETSMEITAFLASNNLTASQLDAVILGYSGDILSDAVYDQLGSSLFIDNQQLWYKHLCGEYFTSTGFALWLAANILKHQYIPAVVKFNNQPTDSYRHILIYNQFRNINHSLMLVSL